MNERIKKLFKKAGGKTSVRNLASNPVQVVETHELWDDHIEKFALLIIRECLDVVAGHCGGDPASEPVKIFLDIEKHFGVEE